MRKHSGWLLCLMMLLLDQLSKHFLQSADVLLIPGILRLHGVRNTGATFGMLAGAPWLLTVVSGAACLFIAWYLIAKQPGGWLRVGLLMLFSGALGNLIDRALRGYVIDFIELQFVHFAIFNLADVWITVGCVLSAVGILRLKE